jgi:hypothetical protein
MTLTLEAVDFDKIGEELHIIVVVSGHLLLMLSCPRRPSNFS